MKELKSIIDDESRARWVIEGYWAVTGRYLVAAITTMALGAMAMCNDSVTKTEKNQAFLQGQVRGLETCSQK